MTLQGYKKRFHSSYLAFGISFSVVIYFAGKPRLERNMAEMGLLS
ncbi:hypothetical protein HMPREF1992_01544 [Selenomonas sp. oral taxon 892 str. F0426]|nr:hypothetical protein HMPREF1992_01544 [Selenomonas sp. oral taxon 892 str. F0426]